jgi:hypothetical protein
MTTDPVKKPKKKKKEFTYERPHRITKAERIIFIIDDCILTGLFWYGIFKFIVWLIR